MSFISVDINVIYLEMQNQGELKWLNVCSIFQSLYSRMSKQNEDEMQFKKKKDTDLQSFSCHFVPGFRERERVSGFYREKI